MVDPTIIVGAAVAVGSVAIAAGYAYFSGNSVSTSVDVDGDGDDDASFTFEGSTDPAVEQPTTNSNGQGSPRYQSAPEDVTNIGTALEQVTGIGTTRKDDLQKADFHTASDLYFASDEELIDVNGIGELTVSQIRGDIGSIEGEGNGQLSDDSTDDESSSKTNEEGESSDDDTDGDGSSTDE